MLKSNLNKGIFGFFKSDGVKKLLLLLSIGLLLLAALSFFGAEGSAQNKGEGASADEALAEMCSAISGAGECRVMMSYKDSDRTVVSAVAVIYTGGGGLETERDIKELIASLYGIGTNRIAVISSKK